MGAFKEELGEAAIEQLGAAFAQVDRRFARVLFEERAKAGLERLELKARMEQIARALHAALDETLGDGRRETWPDRLGWMEGALATGVRGFRAWPVIDSVALFGRDRPAESLPALARMTSAFSAEFAVRPFLLDDVGGTLAVMQEWTRSKDEHVRRLASEGSRPVLPWGIALPELKADPQLSRPILEALRHDEADYVRRSVANHMNDHSRLHADYVLRTIRAWGGVDLPWARHALRTLIKQGHPEVWPLLGFDAETPVRIELLAHETTVRVGGAIAFELQLTNPSDVEQAVMLDYQVHFVRAKGPRSVKVFKLRELRLQPGESRLIKKAHSFRPVTTRRDYPGEHRIVLQWNGREGVGFDFELLAD